MALVLNKQENNGYIKIYVTHGANDSAANNPVVHLWTWYTEHN